MPDHTIFAWTEPTPPEGYPAYINLKRDENLGEGLEREKNRLAELRAALGVTGGSDAR